MRINASRQQEKTNGKDNRDECALHLQHRQGRLPLQSLHLQELRLLMMVFEGAGGFSRALNQLRLFTVMHELSP